MTWQKFVYLIFFVNKLFWMEIIQGTDGCRTLRFNPSLDGKFLDGHVIESSQEIMTKDGCELECFMNADCVSYSFGTNVTAGEKRGTVCELSDSTADIHPGDVKNRTGFSYTPAENTCVDNYCSPNSRCQTGFTDRGYRCVCDAGITGEFCETEIRLGEKANPGKSCKDILDNGAATDDGEYWIDPEKRGRPLKVYCDMTTDGGGWLLVTNILGMYETGSIQQSWAPASSYDEINNYNYSQNVGITASALGRLRLHLNFTQLRFHCSKQHGRTFHVITATNSKGEAVVQYFSGQTDTLPGSCDSFRRMNDDTSVLALNCALWGNDGRQHVGKWGHHDKKDAKFRLYDHAAFIASSYHWHIVGDYWLCDDANNLFTKSARDFWKIFVR